MLRLGRRRTAWIECDRSPAGPGRSVAVLPFTNMSPQADNEYFSDGVTEEILTLLTRIEGLKVISRTSVMQYKGTVKPMRQIGEELGVTTILEGVRHAGQRVRITAQHRRRHRRAPVGGPLRPRPRGHLRDPVRRRGADRRGAGSG